MKPTEGDTRSILIAVARGVFAREGYDGASIRTITTEAGANLGAVTYHFGSKRDLYGAVLESVLRPLVPRVKAAVSGPGSGLERTLRAVGAFFDHLSENPDQPGLMMQEIAAGRSAPEPVLKVVRATLGTIARTVREGQADRSIRPGDPQLLTLSSIAQPVYLTLVRKLAPPVLGPINSGDVTDHVLEFVRRGLATAPGGDA
ncbi:MAG: TetR/AcrR family transcriptional regulator [Gemmatimonadota bacterium]|nr:TetR/AcrR family transcriptional regulator [Gemmatimonadota bacterium]